VAQCDVPVPLRICGVVLCKALQETRRAATRHFQGRLRQALSDDERVVQALQRRRQVTLSKKHVANLALRHAEVALPASVSRIGLRQTFSDRERGAVASGADRRSP
jgi:hypothetical protein